MKSFASVLAAFPEEVRARYDFSKAAYAGALSPITGVVCSEHGTFQQYAARFRKGWGCPTCGHARRGKDQRTPAQEFFSKVRELHANYYTYDEAAFTHMNGPILATCPEHGQFSISANKHYYRKQGCGQCENKAKKTRILSYRHLASASKIANTGATFFDKCREAHRSRYSYPEQEYLGAKEKIRVLCPDHGEFEQNAWAHLQGHGCPACGAHKPQWEEDMDAFVQSLGFATQRSAKVLDKRHIDIYLPEQKIGIELHGLRWHAEGKRSNNYHKEKWEVATNHGIRLLQIFEDEWNSSQEIIKERIKAVLGAGTKIAARKCAVRLVDSAAGRKFLEQHHLQGAGTAALYYALEYAGEVVAVASFGRSRSGSMTGAMNPDEWEVIRYASKGRVQGGFSRLLKQFEVDVAPKKIISYCDLRYGDGKLYQATGFALEKITEPDYWWVPNGKVKRIPRYETQKHKLPTHPVLSAFYGPGKTEAQICEDAGWRKIFGVGHQKWVRALDS